jgi:CobQ-like glutamine amidotransferase family enzyme
MKVHIVHLYPEEMNIYGDTGNQIVLAKRLEWRGIEYKISEVGVGDDLPNDTDLIIGGGGQDAGQVRVGPDLIKKSEHLKELVEKDTPMLMICGLYQLFGNSFTTSDRTEIEGAGILPLHTEAGEERLIGNIVISTEWGKLVGYENHSGRTWLEKGAHPFGRVLKGAGNNGFDQTEGIRYKNVFGSYMHGPILSKNPNFADFLLQTALSKKGYTDKLTSLDDAIEQAARDNANKRPR